MRLASNLQIFEGMLSKEHLQSLNIEMESRGGEQYRAKAVELPSLAKCQKILVEKEDQILFNMAPTAIRKSSSPISILSKGLHLEIML
jgi:hypothetical protein